MMANRMMTGLAIWQGVEEKIRQKRHTKRQKPMAIQGAVAEDIMHTALNVTAHHKMYQASSAKLRHAQLAQNAPGQLGQSPPAQLA